MKVLSQNTISGSGKEYNLSVVGLCQDVKVGLHLHICTCSLILLMWHWLSNSELLNLSSSDLVFSFSSRSYGCYRPWSSPLEKKLKGWQRAWWHYAQKSVLSDVQRRLRRTSWKYFGERL